MPWHSNKFQIAWSALLTAATVGLIGSNVIAGSDEKAMTFDEIDVQRINVRETDGTLRMVITNSDKAPGLIFRGKERPHPSGRQSAGMLFFNDEGTENGGLSFSGRTAPDGTVSGGGHLSFDQYEQDQVIQLTQSENDGSRFAAMIVTDRPDEPLAIDLAERIMSMPDGPERAAMLKKVQEDGTFGHRRVFVGKSRERESVLLLHDAKGRPRMLLKVTPEGEASINFLDENGEVVKSVSPD